MPGIGSLQQNGPEGEVGLTSFHYKNALFIAVDEYASAISADSPTISPAAMEWLRAQMAAFNRPHVFAYAHAPAYEVWDSKARTDPLRNSRTACRRRRRSLAA